MITGVNAFNTNLIHCRRITVLLALGVRGDKMAELEILKPGVDIRPILTLEEAKQLVKKLYGFKCRSICELNGYDDRNFKIDVAENFENEYVDSISGDGYVLKIMNSLDSRKLDFVDAQNQLLIYLGNNAINCPTPVPNIAGSCYSLEKLRSGSHVIRLMKFIPGVILSKAPAYPNLYYEIGTYVANLDKTLQQFSHPIYQTHKTLWMLDSVPELLKFLFVIENVERRRLIEDVINEFERRVLINVNKLEKGMLHGDLNEQNILVDNVKGDDWRMKAVLDFGDSQFSCYLFELAITMTYAMIVGRNLDMGGYVLAGYVRVRKIPEKEFLLLKICVEARLCQSLVMGAYSSAQNPYNSYVLTTSKPGWILLLKLRSKSDEEILKQWRDISLEYYG